MHHFALLLQLAGGVSAARPAFDSLGQMVISSFALFVQGEQFGNDRLRGRCRALLAATSESSTGVSVGGVGAGCRALTTRINQIAPAAAVDAPYGFERREQEAMGFWLSALQQNPADSIALQLLIDVTRAARRPATGTGDQVGEGRRSAMFDLLVRAEQIIRAQFEGQSPTAPAYRACMSLAFVLEDVGAAHDCGVRALAAGMDSSWHAIRLAWLAVERGDLNSAGRWIETAAKTAMTPAERAELGWHLQADEPLDRTFQPLPANSARRARTLARWDSIAAAKQVWLHLPAPELDHWLARQNASPSGPGRWHGLEDIVKVGLTRVVPAGGVFERCATAHCQPPPTEERAARYRLWNLDLAQACLFVIRPGRRLATNHTDRVTARQWDTAQRIVTEEVRTPIAVDDATLTAVISCSADQDSWSVALRGEGQRPVRSFFEAWGNDSYLEPLTLSDLVLGLEGSLIAPAGIDRPIPIPWNGAIATGTSVRLYYQLRSDVARSNVVTEWSFVPLSEAEVPTRRASLTLTHRGSIESGVTITDRVLDLATLKTGRYRMLIQVRDVATGESDTAEKAIWIR